MWLLPDIAYKFMEWFRYHFIAPGRALVSSRMYLAVNSVDLSKRLQLQECWGEKKGLMKRFRFIWPTERSEPGESQGESKSWLKGLWTQRLLKLKRLGYVSKGCMTAENQENNSFLHSFFPLPWREADDIPNSHFCYQIMVIIFSGVSSLCCFSDRNQQWNTWYKLA